MKKIRVRKVDERPARNTGERSYPDPGEMFSHATTSSSPTFVYTAWSPMQGLGSQTDLSWLVTVVEQDDEKLQARPVRPQARPMRRRRKSAAEGEDARNS